MLPRILEYCTPLKVNNRVSNVVLHRVWFLYFYFILLLYLVCKYSPATPKYLRRRATGATTVQLLQANSKTQYSSCSTVHDRSTNRALWYCILSVQVTKYHCAAAITNGNKDHSCFSSLLQVKTQKLTMTFTTRERRSVCFVEEHNITHVFSCDADEDQWVSQSEFDEVKRRMKRIVQEWKMKGYGVLLRNTFDNPHPSVQRNLDAYCQLDGRDCVRGMERSLCGNLDQKVSNLKRRCIKTVLSHQRIMRKDGKLNADEMEEELAVVSRMQSRPCVQFARRLGKADETVLRSNVDTSAVSALQLVEHLNTMTETLKPRPTTALGVPARNHRGSRPGRAARIA